VLGEGAFGRVFPAKHRDTGQKVRRDVSCKISLLSTGDSTSTSQTSINDI
jgi:hypothetical protein